MNAYRQPSRGLLAGFILWACSPTVFAQGEWRPLFNGKDLTGWTQMNGTARYAVEAGAIVGTTVLDSPNSFLGTSEEFGDFILEYEVKVESIMNSGVQIRGLRSPAYKEGRVFGYQVEIDPTERAWTGGIYDESRRGWLHTLEFQQASKRAFRMSEWNRFRVEAIGNSIRTWLNGVPCGNLLDNQTAKGFIALQVHSINEAARAGENVRFRNIRIMTTDLERQRTPDRGEVPQQNHIPNTLIEQERVAGFKLLWDGKSAAGWRGAKLDRFPDAGWEIKDGVLSVKESAGAESAGGGDIVTVDEYQNFELSVEFMITAGANSGIKYFVDPGLNKGAGSAIGCEFQILDDAVHPDAKMGTNGNRKLAGLYDLMPPENIRFNGVGEWNRARILVKGAHVEHWLNGFKTIEYERGTQMWRALVSHSKYVEWPRFGEAMKGRILLQDHGNRVSFRSIKIRELK